MADLLMMCWSLAWIEALSFIVHSWWLLYAYEIILRGYSSSNMLWTWWSLTETGILQCPLSYLIRLYHSRLTRMLLWCISLVERNGLLDELAFSLFSVHWRFQDLGVDIVQTRIGTDLVQSCVWVDASAVVDESGLWWGCGIEAIQFHWVAWDDLIVMPTHWLLSGEFRFAW